MTHKERMIERRERQRNRQRGFTAMPNARINTAIQEKFAVMVAAELAEGREPDVRQLQEDAVRAIAATLPIPSPSKLYRYRPSKSDSAAYRKATVE